MWECSGCQPANNRSCNVRQCADAIHYGSRASFGWVSLQRLLQQIKSTLSLDNQVVEGLGLDADIQRFVQRCQGAVHIALSPTGAG